MRGKVILLCCAFWMPLLAFSSNYDSYPESCQEAFVLIDSATADPALLKEKHNLSVYAVERVKFSAIEEIERYPDDAEMICFMVMPALQLLLQVRNPPVDPFTAHSEKERDASLTIVPEEIQHGNQE